VPATRPLATVGLIGQPEVEDADPPVGAEDRVVGLEVAMDEPGAVGGGQTVGGLAIVADELGRGAGPVA
jgi:hypothetical protein